MQGHWLGVELLSSLLSDTHCVQMRNLNNL